MKPNVTTIRKEFIEAKGQEIQITCLRDMGDHTTFRLTSRTELNGHLDVVEYSGKYYGPGQLIMMREST